METTTMGTSAIGKRIRLERTKRSLTQERLAELSGLSPRTIQRIENGADVASETMRLLANALEIPVESLRQATTRIHFSAPWGTLVKSVTAIACVAALAFPMIDQFAYILTAIVLCALPFMVTGYSVRDGKLLIHRLGWATRYDLAPLTRVEVNPQAMVGSIRLLGNGGIFGLTGMFRNSVIGRFRAFATQPKNSVVMEFKSSKIVVTPDAPEEFEQAVLDAIRGIEEKSNSTSVKCGVE